jgi:glycosyltransferase involved in cell wall biosynthesis
MKEKPLISILMPAKNVGIHIESCIQSIINQSYTRWELVIVNDHSTDNTLLKIKPFLHDKRISLFNNEGCGIISALKTSFKQSSGEYISRMDADDIMPEDKLLNLLNVLISKGKGFISTGFVKYFSDEFELKEGFINYEKWLNNLTKHNLHWQEIYTECPIASPAWLIHREDLVKCGGFNSDIYPEDYDLIFRIRNSGIKVAAINELVHLWRDHSARASRNDDNYKNNLFSRLKVMHFVNQDYCSAKKLFLWGSGKKGKEIAKHLIDYDVDFIWMTNNAKKIGHFIYNKKIVEIPDNFENSKIIIAVSGPTEKREIQDLLKLSAPKASSYFFC